MHTKILTWILTGIILEIGKTKKKNNKTPTGSFNFKSILPIFFILSIPFEGFIYS